MKLLLIKYQLKISLTVCGWHSDALLEQVHDFHAYAHSMELAINFCSWRDNDDTIPLVGELIVSKYVAELINN